MNESTLDRLRREAKETKLVKKIRMRKKNK
jgi:hypothetical protein